MAFNSPGKYSSDGSSIEEDGDCDMLVAVNFSQCLVKLNRVNDLLNDIDNEQKWNMVTEDCDTAGANYIKSLFPKSDPKSVSVWWLVMKSVAEVYQHMMDTYEKDCSDGTGAFPRRFTEYKVVKVEDSKLLDKLKLMLG